MCVLLYVERCVGECGCVCVGCVLVCVCGGVWVCVGVGVRWCGCVGMGCMLMWGVGVDVGVCWCVWGVGVCWCWVYTRSVRKVSDLWPGKRNWLTWSVGHLITLKVVPLGLHTLLPAVPPLLEACRKSLFRNGV